MKIAILFKNRTEVVNFTVRDEDREKVRNFLRGGYAKTFSFVTYHGKLVMIQVEQVQSAYETIY